MNDYWNDPPEMENPEPPPCPGDALCGGYGEYQRTEPEGLIFKCDTCACEFTIKQPAEVIPEEQPTIEEIEAATMEPPTKCPHGNDWHECDACLHQSDLAYDAYRERRK